MSLVSWVTDLCPAIVDLLWHSRRCLKHPLRAGQNLEASGGADTPLEFLLTTNPGLEAITAAEALHVSFGQHRVLRILHGAPHFRESVPRAQVSGATRVVPSPSNCPGYVAVGGVKNPQSLLALRSVHDVLRYCGAFSIRADAPPQPNGEGVGGWLPAVLQGVRAVSPEQWALRPGMLRRGSI
jgi:hypothetical protein